MGKLEQFKEKIKERFSPEKSDYEDDIAEKVPFVRELDLSTNELAWIADVKKGSEEYAEEEKKMGHTPPSLTAFDYVELHMTILRVEQLRSEPFSKTKEYLEKRLDEKTERIRKIILDQLEGENIRDFPITEEWLGLRKLGSYEHERYEIYTKLKQAQTVQEKLEALTLYLNVVHHGGARHGIPGGYASKKETSKWTDFTDVRLAQRDFLKNLNELGNPPYWNKKKV
jgi:hypothetical protein